MGNSTSKSDVKKSKSTNEIRPVRERQNYSSQFSLSSFVGNLSGRSFLSVASNQSFSSRPLSRVSRRRWNTSTLTDPLLASKTAWPVPHVEALFLPEFKVSSDIHDRKFEILETISKGAYGKVYKIKKVESGEVLALKVLSKAQIISENAIRQVKDEVHIQEVCGHNPFIVGCLLKWQSKRRLYIVTEYIPGGELFTLLNKYIRLPEELVRVYVAEIGIILDFLHNAGVVFRDLKPENLLLTSLGHIRLIDFGLSKWLKFGCRTSTVCGTLQYLAPEVLSHEPYDHAVDWWALGIIMCKMLTDKYPNAEGDIHEDVGDVSDSAKRLLLRLLDVDPRRRLHTIKTLQETAFYKDFNFAQVRSMTICPNDILKKHFPDGPPHPNDEEDLVKQAESIFSNFDKLNFN